MAHLLELLVYQHRSVFEKSVKMSEKSNHVIVQIQIFNERWLFTPVTVLWAASGTHFKVICLLSHWAEETLIKTHGRGRGGQKCKQLLCAKIPSSVPSNKEANLHTLWQCFQFSFPNSHSSEMLSMQKQRKKIPWVFYTHRSYSQCQ